jgi:hypothetical protein
MARKLQIGFGTMSKKLALSSALSVALMAAFALFGQQAAERQTGASNTASVVEVSAAGLGG